MTDVSVLVDVRDCHSNRLVVNRTRQGINSYRFRYFGSLPFFCFDTPNRIQGILRNDLCSRYFKFTVQVLKKGRFGDYAVFPYHLRRFLQSGSVSVHEFLFFAFVPSAHCLIIARYSGPPFYFGGATVGTLLKNGRSNFSTVAADS